MSFVHHVAKERSIQLCAETCRSEKRFTPLESSVSWFLVEPDNDAFDD